jgi:predicted peroxiredoxin
MWRWNVVLERLVVKSGAGADDPERCAQALTVASTAAASGVAVSLWLMGEAVHLARPGILGSVVLDLAPSLDSLLDVVLDAGTVTVCTQCAARRSLTVDDFLPGVRIAGAASYVDEILQPSTQAITY